MVRFLGLLLFFIIVFGLLIHADTELPSFLSWIGHLPGDLILRKKGLTLYIPVTSSCILSLVLSLFLSVFTSKN